LIVFREDKKEVNEIIMIHFPKGPTIHYKVSNIKLSPEIHNVGRVTDHNPELILNNFNTKVGRRVGRFFSSLFPQDPDFRGRRVVTFHNQRDFIFFRHHR
jgi:ribosome production factor 1